MFLVKAYVLFSLHQRNHKLILGLELRDVNMQVSTALISSDECIGQKTSLDTRDRGYPRVPATTKHQSLPGIVLVSMATGCHRQVEPSWLPFIDKNKRACQGHSQDMCAGKAKPWQRMFVPYDKQVYGSIHLKREGMFSA